MSDFTELTKTTHEQVELMTNSQLTKLHNELAEPCKVKPIKKFTDRNQGIKRVAQLLEVARKLAPAKPSTRKRGISGRCCDLILQGKPDTEIWLTIKKEFNLDDTKQHYPRWNRAMLKRTGKL